jgi:DNA-binding MarR family transcriptional regulator
MTQFAAVVDREQLYELSSRLRRLADMMVPGPRQSPPAAELVRSIIRRRRMREEYLGRDLFADPAWDMLLDLYAARLEQRRVSVSSLCVASAVPPTTALRWIALLESKGHVAKNSDAGDRRRIFVEIIQESADKLQAFLAASGSVSTLLV